MWSVKVGHGAPMVHRDKPWYDSFTESENKTEIERIVSMIYRSPLNSKNENIIMLFDIILLSFNSVILFNK